MYTKLTKKFRIENNNIFQSCIFVLQQFHILHPFLIHIFDQTCICHLLESNFGRTGFVEKKKCSHDDITQTIKKLKQLFYED